MKNTLSYSLGLLIVLLCFSCEKDNFDAPKALLEGQITYDGQALSVRSNSAELELWQDGYALNEFIPVFIAQDGTYSVSLFDGEYKMVRKGGDPWLPQLNDTIVVNVSGQTQFDVPVTPYINIKQASYEAYGNQINVDFEIIQVVESANLQDVNILLGRSVLVDQNINDYSESINLGSVNLDGQSSVSIEIPENLRGEEYLFVRMGVRSSSSNELIYTQVERMDF